jgi:serine protease Do
LISQIAKLVGPSVVSVNVTVTADSPDIPPELEQFFGVMPSAPTQSAAGTGFIINTEGVIITNRHVVPEGTDEVSITLSDGTELTDVSVIGRTSQSDSLDIAFLKINDAEGKKLVPAKIGDSSRVQVGDDVVAIGNALGRFQNTVTSGIISGFGRSVQASSDGGRSGADVESLDNLFQTDAAINQGNSGGPLVNLNGQIIGINTAVAGNAQNIGFAIPVNDIKGLITQVLKNGKVVRPFIGVRYIPLTADLAKQEKLSVMSGAYVLPAVEGQASPVLAGSPAAKAGLKPGDVITRVAGKAINERNSLTSLLGAFQPGEKIELTVSRDGKNQKVNLTLGSTGDL